MKKQEGDRKGRNYKEAKTGIAYRLEVSSDRMEGFFKSSSRTEKRMGNEYSIFKVLSWALKKLMI